MTERSHARADCSGTDEHNLFASLALFGNLPDQLFHLAQVGLLAAIGQDAGAELYDDA